MTHIFKDFIFQDLFSVLFYLPTYLPTYVYYGAMQANIRIFDFTYLDAE